MRKILLFVFAIFLSFASEAQTFTTASGSQDTVYGSYVSGPNIDISNKITGSNANPVVLKWKVIAMNFSAGWDAAASGICDNNLCRYDINSLFAGFGSEKSFAYNGTPGDFHVSFAANNPAVGSKAVVTVRVTDTVANYTRNLTFIVYRAALGIGQAELDNSISVYPNPARDFVNVVFDKESDVKTIAIFNLIGKTVKVFKPSDNTSAKLDLDNVPSGVYFLRLMNGQGQVVATRRFTRQ